MQELGITNLHVFFRYMVTGTVLTFWLILSLPPFFLQAIFLSTEWTVISTTALLLFVLLVGWASYHAIYPVWRWFLSRPLSKLSLYPRSQVQDTLAKYISDNKIKAKSREVWSYYLWNYCSDSVRGRIRLLADYGHSLYIVSFAFIFFPVIYLILKCVARHETVLDRLLYLLSNGSSYNLLNLVFIQAMIALLSFIIGAMLLMNGRDRIAYAEAIQWLILRENKSKIQRIMNYAASEIIKPYEQVT